jgi:class 3 adenylate cyclase
MTIFFRLSFVVFITLFSFNNTLLFAEEDNEQQWQLLEKSYQDALAKGNKREAAEAAVELAKSYASARDRSSDAVGKFNDAVRIAKESGDKYLEGEVHEAFGDYWAKFRKDFADNTLQQYRLSAEAYKAANEKEDYARVLYYAGKCFYDYKNDKKQAQNLLFASFKIAIANGYNDWIESNNELLEKLYEPKEPNYITMKEMLAKFYRDDNDPQSEAIALEDLITSYVAIGETQKQAATAARLGELYERLGQRATSYGYYEEAVDAYTELANNDLAAKYKAILDRYDAEEKAAKEAKQKEVAEANKEIIPAAQIVVPVGILNNNAVEKKVDAITDSVNAKKDNAARLEKEAALAAQKAQVEKDPKKRKKLEEEAEQKKAAAQAAQAEIDKLNEQIHLLESSQKYFMYGLGASAVALVVFVVALFGQIRARKKLSAKNAEIEAQKSEIEAKSAMIEEERAKSEELLLNILPQAVANELKTNHQYRAREYDMVSVIFTDFKGFTEMAGQLSAQELIEELDYCFRGFDEIVGRNGLEKIKTIGDAYMCAGGIPTPNFSNPENAVKAALEMTQFIKDRYEERKARGLKAFQVRVGVNTGPVIAGVVGTKKFAYDIWGDAVNIAARMESSGEPGKVNISPTTYQFVKNKFKCVPRGQVYAKGKGEMDMYFVEGVL